MTMFLLCILLITVIEPALRISFDNAFQQRQAVLT